MAGRRRVLGVVVAALAVGVAPALAGPDLRLIDAVRARHVPAVRSLLRQGADVNTRQPDGATALHWAVELDEPDLVALLVRAGADVDASNDLGVTPLFLACDAGSARLAALLLDAGARPDARTAGGETPLMAAVHAGSTAAVTALLSAGASVSVREPRRDQTPLMWAAAGGHTAIVKMLVDAGADVQARSRVRRTLANVGDPFNVRGRTVTDASGERIPPPEPRTAEVAEGGSTALLFAARSGDVESARLLLDAGADVNDAAADGTSALVLAAHSDRGDVARLLLARGARVDAAGSGYTALHAAILRGNRRLVHDLVAHGANPDAPVTRSTPGTRFSCNYTFADTLVGSTPFLLAARFAEPAMMRILAAAGGDTALVPDDGMTPLMLAAGLAIASGGRRQRSDCNEGPSDSEGAALEAVAFLLALGADVDAADAEGNTALHGAAMRGFPGVVQLLVDHGARLDARNRSGATPRTVASPGSQGLLQALGAPD
ncbi:MAG: hypothetical protein FJW23_14930 [Acidimicrobiia bacterium]|nr:hypothetical protein [Acidimicrobiia bacterium]